MQEEEELARGIQPPSERIRFSTGQFLQRQFLQTNAVQVSIPSSFETGQLLAAPPAVIVVVCFTAGVVSAGEGASVVVSSGVAGGSGIVAAKLTF